MELFQLPTLGDQKHLSLLFYIHTGNTTNAICFGHPEENKHLREMTTVAVVFQLSCGGKGYLKQ